MLRVPGAVALRHLVVQLQLRIGQFACERFAVRLFGACLRSDVGEFGDDLRAALFRRLGGLPQLQELEIEVVAASLLRRNGHAIGVVAPLRRFEIGFDGVKRRAGDLCTLANAADRALEFAQFALPREHAVQIVVGRQKNGSTAR